MQQYMDNQESRGKKGLHQVKVAIQILKDYAGEQVTMEDVDKTFCKGYIDYLLTVIEINSILNYISMY